MKTYYRFKILLGALLCFTALMMSCDNADTLTPTTGNEVTAVTIIMPSGDKFNADMSAGMTPKDTIVVNITGPRGTNLTRLSMVVSIPNNARITPGLGQFQDFTKPVRFTVTGADGSKRTYTVIVHFS